MRAASLGAIDESYVRTVQWKGRVFKLRADTRGYRYEIEPPVTVDVLPGRIAHSRPKQQALPSVPQAPRSGSPPATTTTPQT